MNSERYRLDAIREFAEQQARFAPVPVRLSQLERAERLLPKLKSDEPSSYQELVHEITSRPTELHADLTFNGADVVHDVLLFIEHMSDSLNLDASTALEPVLTQDELGRKYNVATKTISRWRARGLGGRRYRFGNRKRLGFPLSVVERFVTENAQVVQSASQFQPLTTAEREWVIRRARRLARWGANQTRIITRLAKRLDRVPETLRALIRQHDQQFPTAAVFPDAKETLSQDEKREIYQALKRGESPTLVAKQFNRTRSSIHRIAKEYRRDMLLKVPLEFFASPEFALENADDLILIPPSELELPTLDSTAGRADLPSYFTDLYAFPVLTREQEYFLFRKMNYLLSKARAARDQLPRFQPDVAAMDAIDALIETSQVVKNVLIRCNLRLVVSVARKHQHDESSFFDMISDGNMVMIHALEKFDYTRGNKFSTYASWSLMRHYARYRYTEANRGNRYRSTDEDVMEVMTDERASIGADEGRLNDQRARIEAILDHLNEREQEAISMRYGIGRHVSPQSLDEISVRLGITKDRARQVLASAMAKLREIVGVDEDDDSTDSP